MRHCEISLEVYAMQPQMPDVTRMGNIDGGIYKFKASMLENDGVDSDSGANVGGICVLCEQKFDHVWCSCSGCICQACQQVLVTRGICERNCLNKVGDMMRPLVSSQSNTT